MTGKSVQAGEALFFEHFIRTGGWAHPHGPQDTHGCAIMPMGVELLDVDHTQARSSQGPASGQ